MGRRATQEEKREYQRLYDFAFPDHVKKLRANRRIHGGSDRRIFSPSEKKLKKSLISRKYKKSIKADPVRLASYKRMDREYAIKNADRIRANARARRERTPVEERRRLKRIGYLKGRTPASILRDKLNGMRYRKANPDKVKDAAFRRRARLMANGVENCIRKISELRKASFCHWCCAKMQSAKHLIFRSNDRTIDHVVPISRGGGHVSDNLIAACRTCNSSKNDKLVHEWEWTPSPI